jgi:putative hydrolase of the HAD superfamily
MQAVIIFDADNTLWDTDVVFRSAQMAMLKQLAPPALVMNANEQIDQLRALDQAIGRRVGVAEYDFHLLAIAETFVLWHEAAPEAAAEQALSSGAAGLDPPAVAAARRATREFRERLSDIPPLFPDTRSVLKALRVDTGDPSNTIAVVVFSEGDERRLRTVLAVHRLEEEQLIDGVIIATKSTPAMERARRIGLERLPPLPVGQGPLTVVVGDSLRREIRFGKRIGALTVYKPSRYMGDEHEQPLDDSERPDCVIHTLSELLPFLRRCGLQTG